MLILTTEEIGLVGGGMSYCDNQDFSVGENKFFSMGEITVFQRDLELLF